LKAGNDTDLLENQLAQYAKEADRYEERQRALLALRFYLRDTVGTCAQAMLSPEADGGNTHYVELLRLLYEWAQHRDEHVCCVNFNYDYLLEQAANDVWGLDMLTLESYIANDYISIVKPHGSVLWQYPLSSGALRRNNPDELRRREAQRVFRLASDKELSFGALETISFPYAATDKVPSVPALTVPVASKNEFVWPDSQERHLLKFQAQVTGLITIGWRAAEPDFVSILKDLYEGLALPAMVVVGGQAAPEEGHAVIERLGLADPNSGNNVTYAAEGFSSFLNKGILKDWLEQR
jgi:hypothetical protein